MTLVTIGYIPLRSRFFLRRQMLLFGMPRIHYLIVDVDGTLYPKNSFMSGLQIIMKSDAEKTYKAILDGIKNKKTGDSESMYLATRILIRHGFNRKHLNQIIEEADGDLRKSFVKELQSLSKSGIKIILATRSSREIAEYFAKKYNFSAGVGAELLYDNTGNMFDTGTLVSNENCIKLNNEFKTKIALAQEALEGRGEEFDIKHCGIITDSFTDLSVMKETALSILMLPSNKSDYSNEQLFMKSNGLFDIIITEDCFKEKLDLLKK